MLLRYLKSLIYNSVAELRVTVFSQVGENSKNWNANSFTISKNLGITVYKNKLHKGKVIKKEVVNRYTIDDDGKFTKH